MFDLTSLEPAKLSSWLKTVGIEIDSQYIIWGIVIALVVLGLYNSIAYFKKAIQWFTRTKNWRKQYINNQLSNYEDYLNKKNYNLFIDTKFTITPPNDLKDPSELEFVEEGKSLMDFYMKKVFVPHNTNKRLYCVLAGSGMGKTTFSIHLFVEYICKYKPETLPFEIKLLGLAHQNIVGQIKSIENKENTILILDALDESPNASRDFETFKNELEEVIEPFRIVVITCRTQFFKTGEEEPYESSLLSFNREKGFQKYTKHYIAPFTEEDINAYLKKKYKKKRERKKAIEIIKKCKTLMVRPLLLSYVDDLLDSNLEEEAYSITKVYKVLIEKWIQRELNLIKPESNRQEIREKLFAFSNDLALDIFANRINRDGWYIGREDYEIFLSEKGYSDVQYSFDGRSLINRDSKGYIKFAHKSFFEYFIALHKYNFPSFSIPKEGMDVARAFYRSMVEDDINTYTTEKIFSLECPILANIRDISSLPKEDALYIHKRSSYDYGRIFHLYADGFMNTQLNSLHVPAHLIDHYLIHYLGNSQIRCIYIKEYIDTDLTPLLSIPSLSYINIETKDCYAHISKNFIAKAKKKEITIVFDNDVCTISKDPSAYLPWGLKIYQLQNKQRNNLIRIIYDEKKNNSIFVKK